MQSHSFTLTCAYKTLDGSLRLDVHTSCSNPNCVTILSVTMITLVNNVQQLLPMNTRSGAVGSLWPIYIPEQYLGATRLRMYSNSYQTLSHRSLQGRKKKEKKLCDDRKWWKGGKGNGAKHHKCNFLWDLVPCEYLNLSYKLGPMQQGISTVQCITVHSLCLVVLMYKCLCKKSLSNDKHKSLLKMCSLQKNTKMTKIRHRIYGWYDEHW